MTSFTEEKVKKQRTILVVEDQRHSLILLKKMLEYLDFEVLTAENGQEAVDICNNVNDFSMILMDLKMPVMDGFAAMRAIKKLHPGLTIIAETAYALSGDESKILAAGFDDYLSKPITRETLSAVIERNLH